MANNTIPIIILIARPAAGKSEIIHYLSDLADKKRRSDFHIGKLHFIDDFPFLWRWFEEDDLLSQMGQERLFTDKDGYFKENYLWDLLLKMINLDYLKMMRDEAITEDHTIIIEFSRGKEHGGYQHALPFLLPEILKQAAILYVDVPWEESLRKNRKRFNPDKPDSILEHSLPDEKLERLYRYCDFKELAAQDSQYISVNSIQVPYTVFNNNVDVTTTAGTKLGNRLQETMHDLWEIYRKSV